MRCLASFSVDAVSDTFTWLARCHSVHVAGQGSAVLAASAPVEPIRAGHCGDAAKPYEADIGPAKHSAELYDCAQHHIALPPGFTQNHLY